MPSRRSPTGAARTSSPDAPATPRTAKARPLRRGVPLLVASLLALAIGAGCEIPTFLVDADLDDDGVVTAADVALATTCLGTEIGAPQVEYDAGGCPVRVGPPQSGCEAADVDRNGVVTQADVAFVEQRVGAAVCNGSEEL